MLVAPMAGLGAETGWSASVSERQEDFATESCNMLQ
jgi:hypothetical protein